MTHPELDHKFDDEHDVHPYEYHEHAVLPTARHEYDHSYGHNYHGSDYFLQ